MNLTNYFDVTDITHIKAYIHLQNHGTWPRGFIPVECELDPTWVYQVAEKLASAYVELILAKAEGETGGNNN